MGMASREVPRSDKTAIELFRRFCAGIKDFGLEVMNLLKLA